MTRQKRAWVTTCRSEACIIFGVLLNKKNTNKQIRLWNLNFGAKRRCVAPLRIHMDADWTTRVIFTGKFALR